MAKGAFMVEHLRAGNRGQHVIPTSPSTPWHEVNLNAETEQNAGSRIVAPAAVTSANVITVDTMGFATTIEVALSYTVVGTTSQEVQVNVFGVDENGVYQVLPDADGTIDVTLTIDNTNDVASTGTAGTKFTTAKKFDLLGNQKYEVHLMTLLDWSTSETGSIYAREY